MPTVDRLRKAHTPKFCKAKLFLIEIRHRVSESSTCRESVHTYSWKLEYAGEDNWGWEEDMSVPSWSKELEPGHVGMSQWDAVDPLC